MRRTPALGARSPARLLLVVFLLAASCKCRSERFRVPAGSASARAGTDSDVRNASAEPVSESQTGVAPDAASPVPPPPSTPPLAAEGSLVVLPVEGFRDAVVALPLGATEKRPVVVALHGNYDRPEWQCDVMRGIVRAYPFVLCPRGVPRADAPKSADRWTYAALDPVRKELDAALEALAEQYADYVDPGPVVFTGFSLGAIYGARLVAADPERFPRVVLTEGGYKPWSIPLAKQFAEGGGRRILFACGQSACRHLAKNPTGWLERAGAAAKVVHGGEVGHTYDGPVAEAIASEWAWLVEGDERWGVLAPKERTDGGPE